MTCHHYCNCPLTCSECIRRFWKWAENHTRGRKAKIPARTNVEDSGAGFVTGVTFYEAAAKFHSW